MCVRVFTKLTNYFQSPIKVREAYIRKTLTYLAPRTYEKKVGLEFWDV